MEHLNKRHRLESGEASDRSGLHGPHVRMASAGEFQEGHSGMDIKMKTLIAIVSLAFFSFTTIAGVSIRTVAELRHENGVMAAKLIELSPKQLADQSI